MQSFTRRISQFSTLDVKDIPGRSRHSPGSIISSTSQSSASMSIRRRVTTFASKLPFIRGREPSKAGVGVGHIASVPWPRSPSRSPSPPSPDIRPPSGLGRRASSISDLDMLQLDSPLSPDPYQSFPSPISPSPAPTFYTPPSDTQARRTRTLSSPALLGAISEAPLPVQRVLVSALQEYEPRSPRTTRQRARQNPPIPLSLVLAHVPRASLPAVAQVSRRFCAAAQLALYRTLELAPGEADACVAALAGAPHLAALVTSLIIPAFPPNCGASFRLALALALRSMRALAALTLPAFDVDLLTAARRGLVHLTLLGDTLPFTFFTDVLPSRPALTLLALPRFVGVPPNPSDVPPAAVPFLAMLDASPALALALAPGRPLRRITLRVASTLYDGLRPAALADALGNQVQELVLVLAADIDARTRARLLGALAKMSAALEVFEMRVDGMLDEPSLQVLYKQVGALLPHTPALQTVRVRAVQPLPAGTPSHEDGPARIASAARVSLNPTLRCVVFPSGARWEFEQGKWVRVN
ncbi:hypothetical protein BC834DRAFT_536079 [Gloeopeniophorella convolvens]|nr:hypothetical protein BC834DRAFT_536079 [Gloeopeniophorella convolvens]